nr:integrating conjugative element protein [Halorhodospira abdelmalekii]
MPESRVWGLALGVVCASSAAAFELELDAGGGEPIQPYIERFEDSFKALRCEPERISPPDPPEPAIAAEAQGLLPVETDRMQAGPLEVGVTAKYRERMAELPRPLCLIGRDERSLRWLAQHRDALLEVGAVCLLVEAQERTDLERVRDLADGVWVQVGPGDGLAEHFGVRRYPVVLTPEGPKQ